MSSSLKVLFTRDNDNKQSSLKLHLCFSYNRPRWALISTPSSENKHGPGADYSAVRNKPHSQQQVATITAANLHQGILKPTISENLLTF